MAGFKRFEDIEAWQKARTLTKEIYVLTSTGGFSRDFDTGNPCRNDDVLAKMRIAMKTGWTAKVLLFSDDLALAGETLIHYYSLRFQIEFNFRDAKQY